MSDSPAARLHISVTSVPSESPPIGSSAKVSLAPGFDWLRLAWLASLAWLVYFVALPCGYMLIDSITDDGFTLAHFSDFAADPKLRAATVNSMLVATGVACLSVAVGVPLA